MRVLSIPYACGISGPQSGGQRRFSNLCKTLLSSGHMVTILVDSKYYLPEDDSVAPQVLFSSPISRTLRVAMPRDFNVGYILRVKQILSRHDTDIIELFHPDGALVTWLLNRVTRGQAAIVYNAFDLESSLAKEMAADSRGWTRILWLMRAAFFLPYEWLLCRKLADHVVAGSDDDKSEFVARYGVSPSRVTVIENIARLLDRDDTRRERVRSALGIKPECCLVLFAGSYSHPPNQTAFRTIVEHIAPLFEKRRPDVAFLIVGNGMPLLRRKNLLSIGTVEEMDSYLTAADMAIAPITHGTGVKIKVIDYLGAGLPLLSTTKGVQGLPVRNNVHAVIVASTGAPFEEALEHLAADEAQRLRIGQTGRRLAEERYSADLVRGSLLALYSHLGRRPELRD